MEEPKVLKYIRNCTGGFVSGAEIAEQMGFTRAAVWKDVETLRRLGYTVEAIPRRGYRLVDVPDRLYPWEISIGLDTQLIGQGIYYFDETDSTNRQAKILLKTGPEEGTLVVAESQFSGRGRLGREWYSPKGTGVWTSLILRPALPMSDLAKLTIMAAAAVRRAVQEETGLELGIKWPNDLLLKGKKVCGILAELGGEVDRLAYLVVGIGLNVNQSAEDFPEALRETAASLRLALGERLNRVTLLQAILRSMEACYLEVLRDGFAGVLEESREYSATIGRQVTVREGAKTLTGLAEGIADDGGLLLRLESGECVTVYSGDTTLAVN